MKTPVVLVALSLAMAILLSASLLIATGARGESSATPDQRAAAKVAYAGSATRGVIRLRCDLIENTRTTAASG